MVRAIKRAVICHFIFSISKYVPLLPVAVLAAMGPRIAGWFSMSVSQQCATARTLHAPILAKKGYIEMLPGTSRGIRLAEEFIEHEGLPLIGRVAAGEPILAQEHVEEHYKVDGSLFHPAADYLLRVNGESMKDIGILDGDLLAVHQTTDVQNGQVIVARVEEDVTVKRYKREGNIVYLHAENDDFSPIKVDLAAQEFNIEGLAVGVIRSADWM